MMTAEPAGVTGGVDTHADIHVAAVVCSTSHRLLEVSEFETTLDGARRSSPGLLIELPHLGLGWVGSG